MIRQIFRQIWVNRDAPELPPAYPAYRDSGRALHPGREFRPWNLAGLGFAPRPGVCARLRARY
jgi:hypothetical protein